MQSRCPTSRAISDIRSRAHRSILRISPQSPRRRRRRGASARRAPVKDAADAREAAVDRPGVVGARAAAVIAPAAAPQAAHDGPKALRATRRRVMGARRRLTGALRPLTAALAMAQLPNPGLRPP